MKNLLKKVICFLGCVALLTAWLFVGYVNSYLDHEKQTTFFIKKFPTIRMEFFDLYANEADHKPIDELSPEERRSFADYCKYRFGEISRTNEALNRCLKNIPNYLM